MDRTPVGTSAPRSLGRYVLHGEIAAGGMATVHLGRLSGPVGFSRTVAIKCLHAQYARDPEFVAMFLDEARLAARIRHPNVVPTLDVVTTDGEIFLVMDYVQGASLARLLSVLRRAGQPADARVVAAIVSGVLHGLHSAHEARDEHGEPLNIVHRDVSPQNVLVGVDGVPRVLDFGVAKAVGRTQTTRNGQIKGKLPYMPPEQLRSAPVTRQTDVYAAAVVLWEALVGKRLFARDNEASIIASVLNDVVEPPSKASAHVASAFDPVVMRGLAREPQDRYPTALAMALDVEKCVGVASPFEVGQWVESIAAEDLAKREGLIREIESSGMDAAAHRIVPPPAPETSTELLSAVAPGHDARSESSRPTISNRSEQAAGRRRRAFILAAAALLGVLVPGLILWRSWHAGRGQEHAMSDDARLAPTVSAEPGASVVGSIPTATAMASAETSVATAPISAVATIPAPRGNTPAAAALPRLQGSIPVHRAPASASPPPSPSPACRASFDEKGHKHWECGDP